jgi:hypothetical protein
LQPACPESRTAGRPAAIELVIRIGSKIRRTDARKVLTDKKEKEFK